MSAFSPVAPYWKNLPEGFDTTKPICFLDFDGVINSANWFKSEEAQKLRKIEAGKKRVEHSGQIDPTAVSFLNEIKDWNFVVSSVWRANPLTTLNDLLSRCGFQGKLIDKTPVNTFDNMRGNEIYEWLRQHYSHYSEFKRFVIFDDDSDMLLWQRDNFIHVDGYFGLSPNHVYRARRSCNI